MQKEEVPLKYQKIQAGALLKGDVVLHQGQIWQCVSKQMLLFINLDSREQQYIKTPEFYRVRRLELIPRQWKYVDNKIMLKGQQLGLGPTHELQIDNNRQFPEMEVIKSEMSKGRRLEYKVTVCETMAANRYLLVGIQFI